MKKLALIIRFLSPFIISILALVLFNIIYKPYVINIGLTILFEILFILLSFIISTIIHELGHMVFGLISGYHLVSFRILNLALVNDGKRLKFMWMNFNPLAIGQCMMAPPKYNKDKTKFYLYNFGGLIFTYSLIILSLLLVLLINNNWVRIIFIPLLSLNLYFGISNSIYFDGGVNDMCNYIYVKKDPMLVSSILYELEFNRNLLLGKRYKAKTTYPIHLNGPLNYLTFPAYIYRFYYAIDKEDFKLAKKYIDKIRNDLYNLAYPPYRTISILEILYADIVIEENIDYLKRDLKKITDNILKIIKTDKELENIYMIYKKISNNDYEIDKEVEEILSNYEKGELESQEKKYLLLKEKIKDIMKFEEGEGI